MKKLIYCVLLVTVLLSNIALFSEDNILEKPTIICDREPISK